MKQPGFRDLNRDSSKLVQPPLVGLCHRQQGVVEEDKRTSWIVAFVVVSTHQSQSVARAPRCTQ